MSYRAIGDNGWMGEWPGWVGGWALPDVCTNTAQLPFLRHWLVLVPPGPGAVGLWECGNGVWESRSTEPGILIWKVESHRGCVACALVRREETTAPPGTTVERR